MVDTVSDRSGEYGYYDSNGNSRIAYKPLETDPRSEAFRAAREEVQAMVLSTAAKPTLTLEQLALDAPVLPREVRAAIAMRRDEILERFDVEPFTTNIFLMDDILDALVRQVAALISRERARTTST